MGVDICPIIPIDIKPGHAHFKQVDGYLQSTMRNIYVGQCPVQIGFERVQHKFITLLVGWLAYENLLIHAIHGT
jgi:hypothetical protein